MKIDKNTDLYTWLRPAIRATFDKFKDSDIILGVELGFYQGEHAGFMLDFCDKLILHVSDIVEIEETKPITAAYKDRLITHIGKMSWDLAEEFDDNSVHFVYVDANHQPEGVTKDAEVWLPKIINGGILGGHDYCPEFPTLKTAVEDFAIKHNLKLNVHMEYDYNQLHLPPRHRDWWLYKQ